MTELGYLSALGLGLAGAGHCLGMCGGIAAAITLGGSKSPAVTVAYHAGRLSSYTLLGALLGFAAGSIDIGVWTIGLRYLAGLMLIGMGLYVADWWRGMLLLERVGARVWKHVQRFSLRWLPLRHWPQGYALGLCWGLMPCGLIYSALSWAATAQHAPTSALIMFLFGVGTLPAMLATSFGAEGLQSFLRKRGLKLLIALLLIISGAWTLYITASHSGHSGHTGGHSDMAEPMDHSRMHR